MNSAHSATCSDFHCSEFRDGLIEVFTHALACFYYGSPSEDRTACNKVECPKGWCTECKDKQSCDGLVSGSYGVAQFCSGGF